MQSLQLTSVVTTRAVIARVRAAAGAAAEQHRYRQTHHDAQEDVAERLLPIVLELLSFPAARLGTRITGRMTRMTRAATSGASLGDGSRGIPEFLKRFD